LTLDQYKLRASASGAKRYTVRVYDSDGMRYKRGRGTVFLSEAELQTLEAYNKLMDYFGTDRYDREIEKLERKSGMRKVLSALNKQSWFPDLDFNLVEEYRINRRTNTITVDVE
jgi:hypothetical protein